MACSGRFGRRLWWLRHGLLPEAIGQASTVLSWGPAEEAMDRTLIANTMILDGSGAAPFSGDVLVEGQRIAAVERGGGLPRDDARVIDGAGAT